MQTSRRRSLVVLSTFALLAATTSGPVTRLRAQAGTAAPAAPVPRTPQGTPDLSGYWELRFDSENIPKARLTAGMTAARLAAQAKKDAHAQRWCNWLGASFMMGDYRPSISARVAARWPSSSRCRTPSRAIST